MMPSFQACLSKMMVQLCREDTFSRTSTANRDNGLCGVPSNGFFVPYIKALGGFFVPYIKIFLLVMYKDLWENSSWQFSLASLRLHSFHQSPGSQVFRGFFLEEGWYLLTKTLPNCQCLLTRMHSLIVRWWRTCFNMQLENLSWGLLLLLKERSLSNLVWGQKWRWR